MDFQPAPPTALAHPMPIVTFDDWHRALLGEAVECENVEIAPEPVAMQGAPLLAALMQSGDVKPKPRRLRLLVPSPRRVVRGVQSMASDSHARQTFAGIAVLVMLLIWAI